MLDGARYAFDAGMVICGGAGNGNSEDASPLELQTYTLSVAATDDRDYKASYSSFGTWVDVSSPGGDQNNARPGILSTVFNNTYTSWQGTSMASPIVAGLAGLIKSYRPDWSNVDVMLQIINTADPIDHLNPVYAGKLGAGRVNAYRALTEPLVEHPKIHLLSTRMDDSELGNGNGLVDPGEQIKVIVEISNTLGNAANTMVMLKIDDWAVEIINPTSSIGELKGLRDIDNNTATTASDPMIFMVDSMALPHRIKGQIEVTADGYQTSFDIAFSIGASVLVVDDEELDNEKFYFKALDSLQVSYDYWDHNTAGVPDDMTGYSTVIWFTEWTFPSLDSTDRAVIANYLDNGGNLFISGQDLGWDLCDDNGTEFLNSEGASRDFYESYFKARYLLDDSEYSTLSGVSLDPIGDGLSFSVYQPGRPAKNQYPDELEPIKIEAQSIFEYPNGKSGAVRHAGSYRTVVFGFGGYEAIVEPEVQFIVMKRVLNWLNGLKVEHTPLHDTEDTENDYLVTVNATAQAPGIGKVELYWDTDGQLPFKHRVVMANMGDGQYMGRIPAQAAGTDVVYTILVQTVGGYSGPIEVHEFSVGPDTQIPTFDRMLPVLNGFSKTGPYKFAADIQDNVGVNPDSVMLFLELPDGTTEMTPMMIDSATGAFSAQFSGTFNYGDSIYYYIRAKDIAAAANEAISDTMLFMVGFADFEGSLADWSAETPWGIETGAGHSGVRYVSDSPDENYVPGANISLTLKKVLDFSSADSVAVTFWSKYRIQPVKAYGYIEFSTDGGETFQRYSKGITGIRPSWGKFEVPLAELAGQDSVMMRFRFETDSTGATTYDGWMIDDVQVKEFIGTGVATNSVAVQLPDAYALHQNYPNPFNPDTHIQFQIKDKVPVDIRVYNMMGQLVRVLIDDVRPAGFYTIRWDGTDDRGRQVSSGIYVYRMEVPSFVQTRKMLLLK